MKNGILIYFALIIMTVAGCLIGGFWGGVLFGVGISYLIAASIGKWQLKKAAARIDAFNQAIINTKIKENE